MYDHSVVPETVFIIHPVFTGGVYASERDIDEVLEAAAGLAREINLDVVGIHQVKVERINPGSLFGK